MTEKNGAKAESLEQWLKGEGRSIEEFERKAMLHQALWYHARLKDKGVTVSVGAGPKKEHARTDAWFSLPKSRR